MAVPEHVGGITTAMLRASTRSIRRKKMPG
jgi:hypothetical protein